MSLSGLPKPMHVKAASEGPDGILSGLSSGKVWVDHSTTDHRQSKGFESAAASAGAAFLEAPITGGMDALRKGQMVAHVGGDRAAFDRVRPVLAASYGTTMYTGEVGSAMLIKVVSNMLCCVQVVAMGEVLMLGNREEIHSPFKVAFAVYAAGAAGSVAGVMASSTSVAAVQDMLLLFKMLLFFLLLHFKKLLFRMKPLFKILKNITCSVNVNSNYVSIPPPQPSE